MQTIFALILLSALAACAATYAPPISRADPAAAKTSATLAATLLAAKRVLTAGGFQIAYAEDAAGIVSTAPRAMRLSPAQADCGTTLGLDYLRDARTSTRVALSILATDGEISVRAMIDGEYRPGAVDQDITLTCLSRGTLEREWLLRILEASRP